MKVLNWDQVKENPILLVKLLNEHGGARPLAKLCEINHSSVLKRTRKFGIIHDKNTGEWILDEDVDKDVDVNIEGEEKAFDGEEERKPKYELKDDIYTIYYGKNGRYKVSISEYDLEEALSLYCVAHLTLNQVSLKMGLTRREFYAIKTAFDITKDSLPFTPEQIDKFTSEEISEKYRVKKKQYALVKYDSKKFDDIEKRIKQMDRTGYWHKELCSLINKVEPEIYSFIDVSPSPPKNFGAIKRKEESKYVVYNADVHSGLIVDNYFNTYNIAIMHQRFKKLAKEIIENVPVGHIYIADLGDTIHGIIHGSTQKYSTWVNKAVMEAMKAYESLFLTLLEHGFEVYFAKVNGNHESIEKTKTDRTEEENFGNIIYDSLKWKYSNWSNLHFIDKIKGLNATIVPLFDYSTLLVHGDNGSLHALEKAKDLFQFYNVKEVNAGHIHQRQIKGNIYYNEAFCGSDQYAGNKFLVSDCGTRIVKYTPQGRDSEFLVRYL